MGLDITAYSQLKPLRDYDKSGEYDYPREVPIWVNTDFPGRCDEFPDEPRKLYGFAERLDFRAGSYGGYNAWRDKLAKLAGAKPIKDAKEEHPYAHAVFADPDPKLPFVELINFADNEGTIGTAVSRKLAADFAMNRDKAEAIGDWFWDRYQDWQKAFEIASDDGAVTFH
jgi:hypothetical protein